MSRLTEFLRGGGVEIELAGDGVDVTALRQAASQAPQQGCATTTGAAMTSVIRL